MSFIPRQSFPFPTRAPSYFLGHMARSLRDLPTLLADIDLVIEARDARIPLTGINPNFERIIQRAWGLPSWQQDAIAGPSRIPAGSGWAVGDDGIAHSVVQDGGGYAGLAGRYRDAKGKRRERIVVYTKRDLAEVKYEEPLKQAFLQHAGQQVFFASTSVDKDVKHIMNYAVDLAKSNEGTQLETKVLVVGMPNVGKSSLLNALRRVGVHKGKAFRTSSQPGHTRKLTGTVRIHADPDIYEYDTPGVTMPFLGEGQAGGERGLKLALTTGIKEGLFEEELVADYLLYSLNLRTSHLTSHQSPSGTPQSSSEALHSYLERLGLPNTPTNSLPDFLDALARRLGGLKRGGELDTDAALVYFLKVFREGKLGPITLDNLRSPGLEDLAGASIMESTEASSTSGISQAEPPPPTATSSAANHGASTPFDDGDIGSDVSATVQMFLEKQARATEAIVESQTQRKKKETAKRKLEKDEKWKTKNADRPPVTGWGPSGGRFARNRGRAKSGR